MPDDSDDDFDGLDQLLVRSMKTLDDQVPSGYFEGLPRRTLARLEGSSMQTTETSSERVATGVPPMSEEKDREEDSGLHDIRSLASSTKLRMSARRSTQHPAMNEDDILASASAGWKAVALPEPARMVSLPELASLPSRAEIEAKDRASRRSAKAAPKAGATAASGAQAAAASAIEAPVGTVGSMPAESMGESIIGARLAQPGTGKGKTIALVGVGLAAAAAAAFFLLQKDSTPEGTKVAYEAKATAPLPEMTAPMMPPPAPSVEPIADEPVAVAVVEPEPAPVPEPVSEPKAEPARTKDKVHKVEIRDTAPKEAKPAAKVAPAPIEVKAKPEGEGDGEPSFDALLKEAGVTDAKKVKPKLDKKSLSGSDIKTGMGSVAGKAQACFQGTQGTASVKLTVDPSGKVEKVKVSGVFGGTPVGACVESAVKSASFPAWDGGPQTFAYSYLLAE